ncbi:hypothetical protein PMG71_17765 [Roseofilum sp. BLCC_M154]|uniref:Uncharacterized protein n=1 Tax=Roseofilum acuticapitatum BLCC-M154 TaxID=3022444 RepID=A0ABT7AWI8_9CYAN|nr:hypothetical protein [Roseofilum acuticapitatum]MDJ1171279.1 hypothetical protein [Roseofilum acuticapitatum BLCC-M154]
MTDEEYMQAFLQVWETNPNNIFTTSGAMKGLPALNTLVVESKDESNEVFADKLGQWCSDYPKLSDQVFAAHNRKFKFKKDSPKPQTQPDKTLDNHYPQIPESLRKRILQSDG